MGFPRQEYWSGLPFPSPGDLPNPGINPRSPALQADSSPSELPGSHWISELALGPGFLRTLTIAPCMWPSGISGGHSSGGLLDLPTHRPPRPAESTQPEEKRKLMRSVCSALAILGRGCFTPGRPPPPTPICLSCSYLRPLPLTPHEAAQALCRLAERHSRSWTIPRSFPAESPLHRAWGLERREKHLQTWKVSLVRSP